MGTENRVAIVTGGSRGIGKAIVEALARDGLRVVLNYRDRAAQADTVIAGVKSAGGAAMAIQADVSVPDQCETLVKKALEAYGRIDVLVNNAAVAFSGQRIGDMAAEDWQRMLAVNLNGPFHLIRAVLPHMRAQRSGHIINLSSNVTLRLPALMGGYTVSKAALNAMTVILAKEEGPNGIRVNAVGPGPINTDMLMESLKIMGKERADAFLKSVPLGRAGEPHEIAAVVAFLVSAAASYVTAQIVYANGGGPGG